MRRAFTFLELVIVLSIIISLSSIIVPNFLPALERAKLRGDIQTVMIMQSAAELYRMEVSDFPAGTDADSLIGLLKESGYLTKIDTLPGLKGAVWYFDEKEGRLKLDISFCAADAAAIAAQLETRERAYVK